MVDVPTVTLRDVLANLPNGGDGGLLSVDMTIRNNVTGLTPEQAVDIANLGNMAFKDNVAISDIAANGVPSTMTYLRGDGAWFTPSGGGGSGISSVAEGTGIDVSNTDPNNPVVSIQAGYLAPVATSGAYSDLSGLPTLGTVAATAITDYASAAQGTLATTALQPAAIGSTVQAYDADLASIAGQTFVPGDILYRGASDLIRLPKGTNGQVLTLSGGLPVWSDSPSGLTLISTGTVGSAVSTIEISGLTVTYFEYELHLLNFLPSVSSAFNMLTSTDGGTTFDTSGYANSGMVSPAGGTGTVTSYGSTITTAIGLSGALSVSTAAPGYSGVIRIIRPTAAQPLQVMIDGAVYNGSAQSKVSGVGLRSASADVDAIRLQFASGNIAGGIYKLYGVKK